MANKSDNSGGSSELQGTRKKIKKKSVNRSGIIACALCNLVVAVVIILGLFIAEPIKQFDFKVSDIATESIVATRDIVDEYETTKLREAAMAAVEDVYRRMDVQDDVIRNVSVGIRAFETVYTEAAARFTEWKQNKLASIELTKPEEPGEDATPEERDEYEQALEIYNRRYDSVSLTEPEQVFEDDALYKEVYNNDYWNRTSERTNFIFTLSQLKLITATSRENATILKNNLESYVATKLNDGIKEKDLEEKIKSINDYIKALGFQESLADVLSTITSRVTYNIEVDKEKTAEAKRLAAEEVEPIIYKKGQIIVTAGQPVTEAQYRLVEALGLWKSGANEYSNYISMAIAIVIICAIQFLAMMTYKKNAMFSIANNIIVAILIIISMYLYIMVKQQSAYVCTAMLAVMLITLLVDGRMALISGVTLSLFSGIYAGCSFAVMVTCIVACTICACVVKKSSISRSVIIMIGIASAIAETLTAAAMEYYMTAKFNIFTFDTMWIVIGGAVASIIAIGMLPVFENVFGVITPIRLLEISNQSQPVLKKLQIEAPGTYYHSIMVGNMAETAADDIGADGLLARVGAYYHDIGKLMNPYMFKENQLDGDNPHDVLKPEESARVIIAHVRNGLTLAEQYRVPKILYQFIEEHHGSTKAEYFYNTACNMYGAEFVNVNDYRYSGKTPSTKECAIVMLADTVEAAARAMNGKDSETLANKINELIDAKIASGQLDNCPITFKEITVIKKSFLRILASAYHKRIEYPKLIKNGLEEEQGSDSNKNKN